MVKLLGTLDSELMNIQQALTDHFVGRIGRHFVFRISTRNNFLPCRSKSNIIAYTIAVFQNY